MMKLRNLMQVACMATAALTAFSCSQEEFENSGRKGNITVNATFEGAGTDTRTTVNDEYKILWQDTDALGLFCSNAESNYSNTKLEYASGAGQTSATFNGSKPSGETAVFSIYPYQQNMSVSGNTLTMTLPATLTNYNGSSNGPMYAKVTNPDNLSALSFKHMAAMIKLTVNKIPAEATTFKIIASNNIAGTCTVDLTAADPILAVTSDESKEITASFTASADIKSRNFYIPLPTGTYSSITAQLTNGSDKVYFTKTLNDKILGRRDILVVPPLDCVVVEATTPSALSTALADSKNLPQEAPTAATVTDIAVSGSFNTTSGSNDGIAIPVLQNSDINLAFNTAPTTSTAAPLTLTDKTNTSIGAPAATATNSVSLAVPETNAEQEAPSVAITMPSTTVTLAAVGNKATYNEVTATTAQQTLIINAGVTVKKLTVKGGNLKIYGKVEQLVHDAGDTTIYIIKGTEASLPATIDSKFVVQSDVAVLKAAFANGEDFKLSADADITGQSVSVPAGKSVVLDLNGYTLTADNSATGKIIVLGKMTLKDSSTEKKGKIVASQDYTAASYNGSLIEIAGEDASMTMESGNISAVRKTPNSNGQYGVGVTDGGDFTMTGGKIEAGWFAVAGNGNYKTQNSIINITDGELISTADYAVYLPQSGTTTISGGKVYGAAGGVCIQRGTLNVEGTALITSKGTGSTGNWGDGTGGLDCAAINVSGAYGIATVNIKGGTLIAEAKSLITEGTTYTPVINVTGGTFSDPSALKYMKTNANVNIKLTADKTCPGFKTTSGQTLTMDLGGKILTLADPTVGSTGTETNSCQLLEGSNVTFKNGTLKSDNNKIMIQNYCNLTLDNMTVEDTNAQYVVSNNCGNISINNTTINAGSNANQFAFDVCGYAKYTAGVTVTVSGTSVINGKVEISKSAGNTEPMKLNITGGTFNGDLKVDASVGTENAKSIISVSGGTFSDPSVLKYMATNATVDIKLLSNINIAKTELATGYILNAANATANLNLNGHDIINSSETADATPFTQIFTVQNGTLNISGNGNVKCDASATAKDDGYRMVIEARGHGTVNIHGGSYYNTQKLNTQIDLIYARENGKINIYGGTFESGKYGTPNNDTDGRYWVLNLKNTDKNTASIQVSGGTFINFNPANPNMDDNESYLVTGYEVTRDGVYIQQPTKSTMGGKNILLAQQVRRTDKPNSKKGSNISSQTKRRGIAIALLLSFRCGGQRIFFYKSASSASKK